jgi:hypothetical protein
LVNNPEKNIIVPIASLFPMFEKNKIIILCFCSPFEKLKIKACCERVCRSGRGRPLK